MYTVGGNIKKRGINSMNSESPREITGRCDVANLVNAKTVNGISNKNTLITVVRWAVFENQTPVRLLHVSFCRNNKRDPSSVLDRR